jgi:hypothetical protein
MVEVPNLISRTYSNGGRGLDLVVVVEAVSEGELDVERIMTGPTQRARSLERVRKRKS